MPRRIVTVDINLLPTLGEQIDDTTEELQGAVMATAAEFGAVNAITVTDPDLDELWEPEGRVVEQLTIRPGALS